MEIRKWRLGYEVLLQRGCWRGARRMLRCDGDAIDNLRQNALLQLE